MSTLWTPGGERPVARSGPAATPPPPPVPPAAARPPAGQEPTEEELAAEMTTLREQLAATPAEVVVANHCFGLFELAALHLSVRPPNLAEAQLAIDAMGGMVEALAGRLGEAEDQLAEALTQLRLAFVQIKAGGAPPV
ncbi:MAG: hypothetical protein ACRDZW_08830 [Acidimicrobiales bacterium]